MARRLHQGVGKKQLMQELSRTTTLPREQCSFVYEVLIDIIKKHLMNGEGVGFEGIGFFHYVDRYPRRSNMTGGLIPKHKQIKFRVGDALSKHVRISTREY